MVPVNTSPVVHANLRIGDSSQIAASGRARAGVTANLRDFPFATTRDPQQARR